jgi:tyrosyl-tRNA synthetase
MNIVVNRLIKRNLLKQSTSPLESLPKLTISNTSPKQEQWIYSGFDPTAKSLHVGNLLAITSLLHAMNPINDQEEANSNINIIALVGEATAIIGDPSGRLKERDPLSGDILSENTFGIYQQLDTILKNGISMISNYAPRKIENDFKYKVLNNMSWFKDFSMFDFMTKIGRYSRIGTMMSRESVKSRMNADEKEGINYTEFSYQLLQAYDFCHLHNEYKCNIQLGGSDQFGNIISGIEFIHKARKSGSKADVYGITTPLLTDSNGKKIGKSVSDPKETIWLDKTQTSPFDFYQVFKHNYFQLYLTSIKVFSSNS